MYFKLSKRQLVFCQSLNIVNTRIFFFNNSSFHLDTKMFIPNSLLLVMIQCTNFYSVFQNTKFKVTACADSPPMSALLVPFSAQISRHCHHSRGILFKYLYKSSVQFSHSVVSNFLQPHELQHARPPCPSPTPGVHPNPCPLRW